MSLEGGSVRIAWLLLLAAVGLACSSRDEPRQVVHRMAPSPPAAGARAESGESPSGARVANAPAAMKGPASSRAGSSVVDHVTSKELEAELNRLEAELGH